MYNKNVQYYQEMVTIYCCRHIDGRVTMEVNFWVNAHTTSPSVYPDIFFSDVLLSVTQHKIFPIAYRLFSRGRCSRIYMECVHAYMIRVTPNISWDKRIHIFGYFFFFSFSYFFLLRLVDIAAIVVVTGDGVQIGTTIRVVFDRHEDVYTQYMYIS